MANRPRPSVKASKKPKRFTADADPSVGIQPQGDEAPSSSETPSNAETADAPKEAPAAHARVTQSPQRQSSSPESQLRVFGEKSRAAQTSSHQRPSAHGGNATASQPEVLPHQPVEVDRSHLRATQRNADTSSSMPYAAPKGYEYREPAVATEMARGMIPATGYKRKVGTCHMVGRIIGILFILTLLAVMLVVGGLTLTEYRPADTEEVAVNYPASGIVEQGQQMSLLTWNAGYAGLSDEADFFMDGGKSVVSVSEGGVKDNLANIERVVAEQNPDIVFLQELDVDSSRSYHIDESEEVGSAFSTAGYGNAFATNYLVSYVPYPIPPLGQVYSGIQTGTRFVVDSATRVQLPCPFRWPVRVVNLKRCLLVERIPIADSDKELVLINLHLEAYDNGEGKAAQTEQLVRLMQREYDKGNYVIAGGDFNQTFSNVDTSAYPVQGEGYWQCGSIDADSFAEGWQLLMDASVPTCRSLDRAYDASDGSFQYYMIDGYICSPNVLVNELVTIDTGFDYSDHNPVRMTITLSDEETVAKGNEEKTATEG